MSYVLAEDVEEARSILEELKRIELEISEISAAGRALVGSSYWEVEPFRMRLTALKLLLKTYAQHGSMDKMRRSPTRLEQIWFSTPVQHASSHFRLRIKASPKLWEAGLSEVGMDISWGVSRLENQIDP